MDKIAIVANKVLLPHLQIACLGITEELDIAFEDGSIDGSNHAIYVTKTEVSTDDVIDIVRMLVQRYDKKGTLFAILTLSKYVNSTTHQ